MVRWFSFSGSLSGSLSGSMAGLSASRLVKPMAGVGFALLLLLGMAVPARANRDMVQFANTIEVPEGAEAHDTVCFFCSVDVKGTVTGDIVVFFGDVHISGKAAHDVVNFFGSVRVDDDASIGHDMVNFFGSVRLGENASVGQDSVVMFGSLHAPASASFHGDRVVQPAWFFWVPLLVLILVIRGIVWGVRYPRRHYYMRGY